jgi:hypothetical protein
VPRRSHLLVSSANQRSTRLNRAEFLGGSILWKGWSHASTEEVPS